MGICTLTVHIWAGPTHTFGGFNFADVWHVQLLIAGWGMVLGGTGVIFLQLQRPLTVSKTSAVFETAQG